MKTIRQIIAIPVGILVAGLAFVCVEGLGQMAGLTRPNPSLLWFPIYVVACIAIPLFSSFFTARMVAGWRYLLTWAFGVPAVLTAEHAAAVDAYKQEKARDDRVWNAHPWIRTSAAFPLFPGLVVSYHEYQVAGLNGWGGWQVHIWYWVGVRPLCEMTHWIS